VRCLRLAIDVTGDAVRACDGSVAVTLALSVTMFLVVAGLLTQTLFALAHHTVLLHTTGKLLTVAASGSDDRPCDWFVARVDAQFAAATTDCVAHLDRLVATVSDTTTSRVIPSHTVHLVAARDR